MNQQSLAEVIGYFLASLVCAAGAVFCGYNWDAIPLFAIKGAVACALLSVFAFAHACDLLIAYRKERQHPARLRHYF